MCRDYTGDHEIMADEMADHIEYLRAYALENGQIEDVTPDEEDAGHQDGLLAMEEDRRYDQTDEELDALMDEWKESMRGCVRND